LAILLSAKPKVSLIYKFWTSIPDEERRQELKAILDRVEIQACPLLAGRHIKKAPQKC